MPRSVPTFRSFVGHPREVNLLRRQLAGAKKLAEPFPNSLFLGPSGVGKTLLAESLAAEYGSSLIVANGVDTIPELTAKFVSAKAFDFVFIDEAHGLPSMAQELLFSVIDNRQLSTPEKSKDDETESGPQFVTVEQFSLILATDRPGKLLNALQKRIPIKIALGYYGLREMREIVDKLATDLNLLISAQASNQIARVSGGTPRTTRLHLENLRRHVPNAEKRQINIAQVRRFLHDFGIDEKGLGKVERSYLRYLLSTAPASVESLSLHLGLDVEYVRRQIEPVLSRADFILIGSGGRRLTEAGRNWIGGQQTPTDRTKALGDGNNQGGQTVS